MWIEQNDAFAARVVQQWTGEKLEGPFVGLLVMKDKAFPMGAIIVNNYTGDDCELSCVGQWFATAKTVRDVFRYLFGELKVRRVTVRFKQGNAKSLKACKALGFVYEGTLRDWYGENDDALVFGLLARDQKLVRI